MKTHAKASVKTLNLIACFRNNIRFRNDIRYRNRVNTPAK